MHALEAGGGVILRGQMIAGNQPVVVDAVDYGDAYPGDDGTHLVSVFHVRGGRSIVAKFPKPLDGTRVSFRDREAFDYRQLLAAGIDAYSLKAN